MQNDFELATCMSHIFRKSAHLARRVKKTGVDEGVAGGSEKGEEVAGGDVVVLAFFPTVGKIGHIPDDADLPHNIIL